MKKIAVVAGDELCSFSHTTRHNGLAGIETFFTYLAEELSRIGVDVYAYTDTSIHGQIDVSPTLHWNSILALSETSSAYDAAFVFGNILGAAELRTRTSKYYYIPTGFTRPDKHVAQIALADKLVCLSNWQAELLAGLAPVHGGKILVASKCVEGSTDEDCERVPGTVLVTCATYRLGRILDAWKLVNQVVPSAVLYLYSSFVRWGYTVSDNGSKLQELYDYMQSLQGIGVVNCVHDSPVNLRNFSKKCDVFVETPVLKSSCSAGLLAAMSAGVLPIVSSHSAYLETVLDNVTGWRVPCYDVNEDAYVRRLADAIVMAVAAPEQSKISLRQSCKSYAKLHLKQKVVQEIYQSI